MSRYPRLEINNSFTKIVNFPADIQRKIRKLLTYEDEEVKHDIQQTIRLVKRAKRIRNRKMKYAMQDKLDKLKEKEVVCLLEGNTFPTGLLPLVDKLLNRTKFRDYDRIDYRERPQPSVTLRLANSLPPLRPYQKEAVQAAKEAHRGAIEAAIGAGKTLMVMQLIKEFSVPSLILAPSKPLTEQIYNELIQYFEKKDVEILNTQRVKKAKRLKPIRLITVAGIQSLKKQDLIEKATEDVGALFCDEAHHAGAESFYQLLEDFDHIYYRIGTTSTFGRNDSKTMNLWSFLSHAIYRYAPHRAVEEGYLTPLKLFVHDLKGDRREEYQEEYTANYCGGRELFRSIYQIVSKIPSDEQILILVDRKEQGGELIHDFLKKLGFDNSYISGDNKGSYISQCIQDFNDLKIRILIGSTVIGEGIDIKSTKHLILARGGRSFISYVQGVGRCARLFEGKEIAYVHDFNFSGTKYLESHTEERVETFRQYFDGEIEWR